MMEFKRGDVVYVKKGKELPVGNEQYPDRPAVIVSNDIGNEHAPIVEIVWLTSQEKRPMPTHVEVMCQVPSVALCEQIQTISKERISSYIRSCTEEEMEQIDDALLISLGIAKENGGMVSANDVGYEQYLTQKNTDLKIENAKLETERDIYKQEYAKLLASMVGGRA
jgi:mRNA interferase MazF